MSLAYFWIFVALLALGMPIVFALLIGPGLSLLIDGQPEYLGALLSRLYNGIDSFPLLAVPLFILAGELMNSGGITRSLVTFSHSLVGHFRGGLAQVNILSSVFMSGISGSAVADASAVGKMMIPEMEKRGYPRDFAAAITAASAVIGPIIPPSGLMILYGFVMNVSIGALFAAGILPGLLIAAALMITTRFVTSGPGFPPPERRQTWRERGHAFRVAFLALLAPVIMLGGLRLGIFTTTEIAAIAVAYAALVSFVLTRSMKLSELPRVLSAAALQSGVILLLVGAAVTFAWIVTVSGLGLRVTELMLGLTDNVYLLLFLAMAVLLLVGMVLDAGPIILILAPVLGPIFVDLGVHPVHFGLVMCVNVTIGLVTPPMGLVLFVASSVSGERLEAIVKRILPFLAVELLVLFVLCYVPQVSLWLPRVMGFM